MSVEEKSIDGSSSVSPAARSADSGETSRRAQRYTGTAVSAITTEFTTFIAP